MALPVNGTFMDVVYNAQIIDVSTASIAQIPVVKSGKLVDGWASISASLTTGNGTITVKKYPAGVSGSAVTCGTITLVQSGSAAGQSFQLVITGSEANCTFAAGDVMALDGDGACDTTCIGRFSMVVRGP